MSKGGLFCVFSVQSNAYQFRGLSSCRASMRMIQSGFGIVMVSLQSVYIFMELIVVHVYAEECQVCQGSLMSLALDIYCISRRSNCKITRLRIRCRSFARVKYKLASLAAKRLRCSNSQEYRTRNTCAYLCIYILCLFCWPHLDTLSFRCWAVQTSCGGSYSHVNAGASTFEYRIHWRTTVHVAFQDIGRAHAGNSIYKVKNKWL